MHGRTFTLTTRRQTRPAGRRLLFAVMVAAAIAAPACRPPDQGLRTQPPEPQPAPRPALGQTPKTPPKPKTVTPRRFNLGTSVEGRPIECLEFGAGDDVVLIMASIHGNEPAGTPLVRRLANHLADQPDLLRGHRLLIVPAANPDGLAHGKRQNARGVDLNRNFPANNYTSASGHGSSALSEPESRALHQFLLDRKPRRIVSLHQPANYGTACIDYDGPAEPLARAMAAQADLPVRRLGGKNGSLGSFAGVGLGIPTITIELPKNASSLDGEALWAKYGKMLLAAICFPERVRVEGEARTGR